MSALFQDLRYAVRWLVANPGLSIVAIGVMAIGIGANTAIFSIVDALLFRPPPFEDSDRVVNLYTVDEDGFAATSSYKDIGDFSAEPGLFEDVVTHEAAFLNLRKGEAAEMVMAEFVSANYFAVLGLPWSLFLASI